MKRSVVTAFLFNPQKKFLLVRRAPTMRAYPNHWSAISGSIEEGRSHEQQAEREILEETGLSAARQYIAEPFVLCDPDKGSFEVYPMRFEVSDEENPQLNEENIELAWVDILPEVDAVPALGESLRRAEGQPRQWLSITLREALLRWRDDRENGAVELSLQAMRLLASCAMEYPARSAEARICMLRGLAVRMAQAHQDMPIIERSLGYVLRGARAAGVNGATSAAKEQEERLQRAREDAAQHAAKMLLRELAQDPLREPAWLTLSASSTVQRAFEVLAERLPENPPHLRVLESRPLGEGTSFAKKLHEKGLRASLYPDIAMRQALQGCRGVLLGADALYPDGSARNKLGSTLLAQIATAAEVPVIIIAESWKISAEETHRSKQLSGESSVPEGGALGQSVPLFERIPREMISNIITEEGALDAKTLEKLSERRAMWSKRPYLLWGESFEEP